MSMTAVEKHLLTAQLALFDINFPGLVDAYAERGCISVKCTDDFLRRSDFDIEANAGIRGVHVPQNPIVLRTFDTADSQQANDAFDGPRFTADNFIDFPNALPGCQCDFQYRHAGFGQFKSMAVPLDQGAFQLFFKALDGLADSRLRQVEPRRALAC
ncbi:hypothetical protein AB7M18_002629 [Pseudomonas viridiflava]